MSGHILLISVLIFFWAAPTSLEKEVVFAVRLLEVDGFGFPERPRLFLERRLIWSGSLLSNLGGFQNRK